MEVKKFKFERAVQALVFKEWVFLEHTFLMSQLPWLR